MLISNKCLTISVIPVVDSVPSCTFVQESVTNEHSEFTREKELPARKKVSFSNTPRHIKEKGKRVKAIYEDEGLDFGSDPTDEETLIERVNVALSLRERRIEEVFRNIRRARSVQLCFVVDCTGSMQGHIDGVHDSIDEILKKLTDDGPQKTPAEAQSMAVAFVAYRDHGNRNQFGVLPFTPDADSFKTFTRGLKASGGPSGVGPDLCEDVFGGLDTSLELAWSVDCGTKVIFHICDMPCHGKEFTTEGFPDGYPAGDPKGRTSKGLFDRIQEKGIQYHFGKITQYTDIMIQKFSEVYGDSITQFDVMNVQDITESVFTSVSQSISASVSASQRTVGVARKEREFTLDKAEPDWSTLREVKGTFVSYEFPENIEDIEKDVPLERRKPKSAIVKVAPNPFGKGQERIAFYGKDVSTYVKAAPKKKKSSDEKPEILKKDEEMILKEYLHTGKGMNSSKRYELSNQMQTVASFLAQKFVKDLKDRTGEDKTIKFPKIRTIALQETIPMRFMSCERRFRAGTQFVRFTNNADYHIMESKAVALGVSMDFVQLVTAFSHWTYKATNGFLMVVDLEGVVGRIESEGKTGVLLTDPAIHCMDLTRYGGMNHGPGGMTSFFQRHKCNKYCKDLDL